MARLVAVIVSVITFEPALSAAQQGFSDSPPCRLEDLNACGADFMLFAKDVDLPLEAGPLQDVCRTEISSAMCTQKFAFNCTQGIVRGVNLLAMENVIDELTGKCTVGTPHHEQYLEHAPCLNKAARDLHNCVLGYLNDVLSIAEFTAKKDKIPFICCRHFRFESCADKAVDENCNSAATKKYLDGVLSRTMTEGLDLICRRIKRTSDKCTKDFARQRLKKVGNVDGPINLLVPLTKIITSASP